MTFKPRLWYPIAGVLALANLVAVPFAAAPGEAAHATVHAVLAVGFALWAQKLRQRKRGDIRGEAGQEDVVELRDEVDVMRGEMAELQERLDFTERMLTQARDSEPLRRPPTENG
jgi:hypothetical protein